MIGNKMASDLWRKINYKTPIKYFINTYIREYDLSKANINTLLYQKRITKKQYDQLYNMDKQNREVLIGLMIRDDYSIYTDIRDGIIEAKRKLFYSNKLEDYDIVAIKNDAVFILSKPLEFTMFQPFDFRIKNEYTMYMQLAELEVYYSDSIDENGNVSYNIDVKGMSDDKLALHETGMLSLICDICYRLQREHISKVLSYLTSIYDKFIQRQLPLVFYRSFDPFSLYTIHTKYRAYSVMDLDNSYINIVDIGRNNIIFRDLLFIVSDIYRTRVR